VLRGKSGGYQIRDTMKIRRGLTRTAHDQAEHLTTLAILVQNGLERRRITRLVISGIEFVSVLPVIGLISVCLCFTEKPKSVDFLW
jgi:hypothetical protein